MVLLLHFEELKVWFGSFICEACATCHPTEEFRHDSVRLKWTAGSAGNWGDGKKKGRCPFPFQCCAACGRRLGRRTVWRRGGGGLTSAPGVATPTSRHRWTLERRCCCRARTFDPLQYKQQVRSRLFFPFSPSSPLNEKKPAHTTSINKRDLRQVLLFKFFAPAHE